MVLSRNRSAACARASRCVLIPADSVVSSSLCRYHTMSGNAAIEEVQNRGKALPRVRMRASKQVAALFALAGNWINHSCQFAVLIQLCCCRGWQHRHARLRRAAVHVRTYIYTRLRERLRRRETGFHFALSFNHAIVGFAIPVVAASVCKTAEGSGGSCACISMRVNIYTGWDVLVSPTARPRDVTAFWCRRMV